MQREIYLDNAATTRPYKEVVETMGKAAFDSYGNPSSLHKKGIEAEKLVKSARETVAAELGVESREIYFTSGGTESNNLAVKGYLEANPRKGKHIITSKIEHPSVLEVFKQLSESGYRVDFINVDDSGIIDLNEIREKISSDTALISLVYVNNEVGAIQPIEELVKIKNSINSGTAIHVDAVQAFGKLKLSPKKTGIDMLSVSSHKIHGPKGVGCLYAGRNVRLRPILQGGGQESLLRSGTENVPGICGFGKACGIRFKTLEEDWNRVLKLKELFLSGLWEDIKDFKVNSNGNSSPYILNISFPNLRSEVLLHHLEERNIFVSTGSACSSRKSVHSHVLKAMGIGTEYIEGAVRFSFSADNTEEDIFDTIDALKEIVPKIQIRKSQRR